MKLRLEIGRLWRNEAKLFEERGKERREGRNRERKRGERVKKGKEILCETVRNEITRSWFETREGGRSWSLFFGRMGNLGISHWRCGMTTVL